jgi:hypothetical protein
MATKFVLWAVLTGAFATLISGCSRGYPSSSYFYDFRVLPVSQERGALSFSPNKDWLAWQEEKGARIDEYGILSPYMPCTGRVSGRRVEYQVETRLGKIVKVIFQGDKGGKIECIFAASRQSRFTIFPVIKASSLFEDGDLEGELEFLIPLGMPIQ